MIRSCTSFFVSSIFFVVAGVRADEPAPFPERSVTGVGGQTISSQNSANYRGQLLPELQPLIRAGRLEFEAIAKLHYDWRYDESWYGEIEDRQAALLERAPAVLPRGNPGLVGIPPFLKEEQIAEGDRVKAGRLAVAASQSVGWSQGSMLSSFDLLSFPRELSNRDTPTFERVASGAVTRVYPGFLQPPDETGQVFRELIEFSAPAPLATLRWLSFRFLGDEEDVVWISSPAINKSRQVVGSLRADRIFPRAFAADDLFGWSGKAELTVPTYDRSLRALLPFPSHLMAGLEALPTGCTAVSSPGELRLNVEANRFSPQAPWLPTGWVWVPRLAHRVVLMSNDPYSSIGRQILYLDDASLLPVVRVVYGRTGRYLATIITSFGLAVQKSSGQKRWYPSTTLIEDDLENQFLLIQYRGTRFCAAPGGDLQRPEFDPRRLSGATAPAAAGTATPRPEFIPPSPADDDD